MELVGIRHYSPECATQDRLVLFAIPLTVVFFFAFSSFVLLMHTFIHLCAQHRRVAALMSSLLFAFLKAVGFYCENHQK